MLKLNNYTKAVEQIKGHNAFISYELCSKLETKDSFLRDCLFRRGSFISPRYDSVVTKEGVKQSTDFLVNCLVEVLVLHINAKGKYSLHYWDRGEVCSKLNRICVCKEKYLLKKILSLKALSA